MEMSRLTRDGTAEPASQDQILRRERGQGNVHFPCSADHVQDWQPSPVDPYSCYMCDHTYHILRHLWTVPFSVGSCLSSLTNVSADICCVLRKSPFIIGRFRNPLWSNNIPLCGSFSIAIQPPHSVVITLSLVGAGTRQRFLATS